MTACSVIAIIISFISLAVSVIHWIYDHIREKPKVKITLNGYLPVIKSRSCTQLAIFSIIIDNQSKLDIAINRLYLTYKGIKLTFEHHQDIYTSSSGSKYTSAELPLKIPTMCSHEGYFFLYGDTGIDLYDLSNSPFVISMTTSRGNVPEFAFEKVKPIVNL